MELALKILILFLIIKGTTFGWRLSRPYTARLSEEEQSTAENLKRTVRHMAIAIGARNYVYYEQLNKTADFIIQTFQDLGYTVKVMPYEIDGKRFRNIIAEGAWQGNAGRTIIIGAHYDSCFNPGADDNASGVAGMLELARLLKGERLISRVKFIAFVNEEPPFFMTQRMGSRVYAWQAREKEERIKVVVILEMIGFYAQGNFSQRYLPLLGPFFPNRGDFIAFVGNFPTHRRLERIYAAFKAHSDFPVEKITAPDFIPGRNFSDHWSFWKEGYPAMMVTDTAFLRSPHYHRETDLPDTLAYHGMAKMLHGLKQSIIEYANE